MEAVILVLTAVALYGLIKTTRTTYTFSRAVDRQPGIGRILFRSLYTLKLWAALVLVYFVVNTFWPDFFTPYRLPIRLLLGVGLVAQTIMVDISYRKWMRGE